MISISRRAPNGSSPLTRGKLAINVGGASLFGLIPAHAGKTDKENVIATIPSAHPRSRGENASGEGCIPAWSGSSPLTRGKHLLWRLVSNRQRLIPAHAGKTAIRTNLWFGVEAHPRSRGENLKGAGRLVIGGGSSPLTRGKRAARRRGRNLERLIPAHAGKTYPGSRRCRGTWAHPRSRGENLFPSLSSVTRVGSSPLTRGKRSPGRRDPVQPGLIPAHAGKTYFLR